MATNWDNSEEAIQVILTSAGLEKYQNIFKGLHLDTFLNLTEEDLECVGIQDKHEQDALFRCLEPFGKGQFEEFTTEPKLNVEQTLSNTKRMLLYLHADMIKIKRFLVKKENLQDDPILEPGATASSASRLFLKKISDALNMMDNYCGKIIDMADREYHKKTPWYYNKIVYIAGAATLLALGGGVVMYRKRLR